jgi:probable phosphoglycerate mutase
MIYFVRHGQSKANLEVVFAGQKNDAELTQKGEEQAREAGKRILEKGLKFSRVISSPLLRTKGTAEIIAKEIGFDLDKIEYDERVQEYDMGSLTGTPIRKVTSQEMISSTGAENTTDFQNRVMGAMKEYSEYKDGDILFVNHAGVGRIMEAYRQEIDPNEFYNLPPYDNSQITRIDWI